MSIATTRVMVELISEQYKRGGILKVPYKIGPSIAMIDAGYCIDARDDMPAGSHENRDCGDELGPLPGETIVWREWGRS